MKKLILVDANSLIHRAFHALPNLSYEGKPSGALFGLANILIKSIKERSPDFIAAAFDRPEKTFRKEIFEKYKSQRPPTPEELVFQIKEAHSFFDAFNIKTFEIPGFEADDVLGSLAEKFKNEKDLKIIILTGDLDMLQLVEDEKVLVEILKKGVSETALYNENEVFKRFGVNPSQLPDLKALTGDKSDNIPGIKGIGPKKAEEIIKKFIKLENIFKLPEKALDKDLQKILNSSQDVILYKKLATIKKDLELPSIKLEELKINLDFKKIKDYFYLWGFFRLLERLEKEFLKNFHEEKIENEQIEQKNKHLLNAFYVEKIEDFDNNKILSKNIKVSWDWKKIAKDFLKRGLGLPENIFDLKIALWLLNPDQKKQEKLAQKILNKENFLPKEDWKNLFLITKKRLEENKLEKVFLEIETPLIEVLAAMENEGIKINLSLAEKLKKEIENELRDLKNKIYTLSGEKFNLNSPKQLSKILFEKLKIKNNKRKITKTGLKSTAFDVLSKIKDNELIGLILKYRENFKLLSTYINAVILNHQNQKIHTNYIQTGTSTGRLASSNPNMQNLPKEGDLAKKIRMLFEAENGFTLVAFDYSQLELRLLAHLAEEENLIKAFEKGLDIHALTASKIIQKPIEKIEVKERRLGKTLNFGIIYGMGPRSFAEEAEIPLPEAKKFIEDYFQTFPKVKMWQESIKGKMIKNGFVENIYGRKRWFNTKTTNAKEIAENERAAINMPVQSLGADLLKKSMIKIYNQIKSQKELNKVKMLLTIHDELIFEIQNDILKEKIIEIKNIMENIEKLNVSLKVDVKIGPNLGNLENYVIH